MEEVKIVPETGPEVETGAQAPDATAPTVPDQAQTTVETAATSNDASIVDINDDGAEGTADSVVHDGDSGDGEVSAEGVCANPFVSNYSQADYDLAVLVEAQKIREDSARFMAAKAIAGSARIQ